jgi:hypothetical protein
MDGGIISSHHNDVDSKEVMWIHHFVILQLSIPSTKMFGRSILSMITMPCLSVTAPTTSFRNMQTYSTIQLDFSMCGWVREFSQFKCSKVTS